MMPEKKSVIKILLAVFAVLVVLSVVQAVSAQPFTYTGTVIAIDSTKGTVTVQSGANDHRTFDLAYYVAVSKCNKFGSWKNIHVGDEVTVSYFEGGSDRYIADFVSLHGTMEHC